MALDAYVMKNQAPEVIETWVRLLGTGASAPTVVYGEGVSITRTSQGLYVITFADVNGTWMGYVHGLEATTLADLDNWSVVGKYDATARTFTFSLYDATPAVQDLAAAQWINLAFRFKRVNVAG